MGKNSSNNKKLPKTQYQLQTTKEAAHTKNPDGYQNQFIAWHFECMDASGSWPCNINTLRNIENRLHEFEKKKWSELTGSSHPLPVDKIIPKAQQRLLALGYGDFERLYQLDIKDGQQKRRLWGLRVENIFKILWWDPKHEIYPVELRRT